MSSPRFWRGVLAAALAFWARTVVWAASPELFVRPGLWWARYSGSSFHSDIGVPTSHAYAGHGGGLSIGLALGADRKQEVSVEWASMGWHFDPGAFGYFSGGVPAFGTAGHGHVDPVLASFRYFFWQPLPSLRLFASASAGGARVDGNIYRVLSGTRVAWSGGAWSPAYGGSLGLAWHFHRHLSAEIGGRYLRANRVDFQPNAIPGWEITSPLHLSPTTSEVLQVALEAQF